MISTTTIITKMKGAMIRAELKTICTVDIDPFVRIPRWCC